MDESQKRAAGSLFHMLRGKKANPDADRGADRIAAAMLRRAGRGDLADELDRKWASAASGDVAAAYSEFHRPAQAWMKWVNRA